ncbi:MAG: AraC family transcriptional regulator [Leptolyngbya sp. SIOISBB]|nr:AraC family transcriptional regulator [Leptolyngbya sp. SIOISBB]
MTHSFDRHAHEEFAIGVIYSGAQALTYRRSEQLLMPSGSIAAINPAEIHTGYAANVEDGWAYRMLYPAAELLQEVASEVADFRCDIPFFPEPVIFDQGLAHQIFQMHCALENPHTPVIEKETYLFSILSQLILRHADSRPVIPSVSGKQPMIQCIRDYLVANYQRNISLTELSSLTNLSKFHLCRSFQAAMGLPPHAYLNLIRVHRAKRLLKLGIPISQVALDVGFYDQTHFTKRFKAVLGFTPKQYATGTARMY